MSAVTSWEIAAKRSLGKLRLPNSPDPFGFEAPGLSPKLRELRAYRAVMPSGACDDARVRIPR